MPKRVVREYEVEVPDDEDLDDAIKEFKSMKHGSSRKILPEELPTEIAYENLLSRRPGHKFRVDVLEDGLNLGGGWLSMEAYDIEFLAKAAAFSHTVNSKVASRVVCVSPLGKSKAICFFYPRKDKFFIALQLNKTHLLEQELLPSTEAVGDTEVVKRETIEEF